MGCSASQSSTPVCRSEEVAAQDFFDKYQLGVKLGRGAFAQVRVAIKVSQTQPLRPDQGEVQPRGERAVKILDLREKDRPDETNTQLLKTARKEAIVWQAVGAHPNAVRLHDVFFGSDFCWMVMEKCSSGLFQVLQLMPELTERNLGNIFAQMIAGIAHCHSQKVVHRDIKPDNYMCGGDDGQVVKLCDFGLSALLPKQGKLPGVYGTAPFMCPEMLTGRGYDEKADVWSFGVIVYALLFGNFPYMPKQPSSKAMKQAIIDGGVGPTFEPAAGTRSLGPNTMLRSDNARSLVRAVLRREPDFRPSAEEALQMPWMVSAMQDQHAIGIDLPSLRPMMHASKKVGLFEVRDPARNEKADEVLNSLQMRRHGMPLPTTPSPGLQQAAGRQNPSKPDAPTSGKISDGDCGSNTTSTTVSERSAPTISSQGHASVGTMRM